MEHVGAEHAGTKLSRPEIHKRINLQIENRTGRGIRVLDTGVFHDLAEPLKAMMSSEAYNLTLQFGERLLLEVLTLLGDARTYDKTRPAQLREKYDELLR